MTRHFDDAVTAFRNMQEMMPFFNDADLCNLYGTTYISAMRSDATLPTEAELDYLFDAGTDEATVKYDAFEDARIDRKA
jgi:hypothetical protein